MRKIIITSSIIVLLVLGILYLVYIVPQGSIAQVVTEGTPQVALNISHRGEDYLNIIQNGIEVGEVFPELVNSAGDELLDADKKALIVNIGKDQENLYPLLQEWAITYKDYLSIVALFTENPAEHVVTTLMNAGVRVNYSVNNELTRDIEQFSFMVNEERTVVHRFKVEVCAWRELAKDIDLFARKSVVPEQVVIPKLKLGQKLPLKALVEHNTNWLQQEYFLGKPTALFLLSPACIASQQIYPMISKLNMEYSERFNVAVIFYVDNYQTDQLIKDYYDRYGLDRKKMKSNYISNPKQLLEDNGLQETDVFFDQNHSFVRHPHVWLTPTVLILDTQMRLVDIFDLDLGGELSLPEVEELVIGSVAGTL